MHTELIKLVEQFIVEHSQPKKFTLIINSDMTNVDNFYDVIAKLYESGIVSKYDLKWKSENSFGNDHVLLYGKLKK